MNTVKQHSTNRSPAALGWLRAHRQEAAAQLSASSSLVIVVLSLSAIAVGRLAICSSSGSFDGLNNGFIYSAMALALVLIYKATGVVNFAQGDMAMFGTFICYVYRRQLRHPGRGSRSSSAWPSRPSVRR